MASEAERRVIEASITLFNGVSYSPSEVSEKCQVRTTHLDELREALIALKGSDPEDAAPVVPEVPEVPPVKPVRPVGKFRGKRE